MMRCLRLFVMVPFVVGVVALVSSPVSAQVEGSVCALPADVGPCDGVCPRFFYDTCTGQCESFTWGCCEGNANNFETLEECQAACPPSEDACFMPVETGVCTGVCPRFFHNPCTGQCESFIWGCCGGNANNFETQAECESACGVTLAVAADIPAVTTWGLLVLTLLLLTAGVVIESRRREKIYSAIRSAETM